MPSETYMTVLAKKLPLLEQFVVSHGESDTASLVPLLDHCPRLQLLDASGCHTWCPIGHERLEGRIKDLRLPRLDDPLCGLIFGSCNLGLDLDSDDEDERFIF